MSGQWGSISFFYLGNYININNGSYHNIMYNMLSSVIGYPINKHVNLQHKTIGKKQLSQILKPALKTLEMREWTIVKT